LAKPTHENIIRFAPPLVISEADIQKALGIIRESIKELPTLKGKKEDEVIPAADKNVKIHLDD
jgi:ornithine--oxo-acid transaminase